jgi:hypothetical protein
MSVTDSQSKDTYYALGTGPTRSFRGYSSLSSNYQLFNKVADLEWWTDRAKILKEEGIYTADIPYALTTAPHLAEDTRTILAQALKDRIFSYNVLLKMTDRNVVGKTVELVAEATKKPISRFVEAVLMDLERGNRISSHTYQSMREDVCKMFNGMAYADVAEIMCKAGVAEEMAASVPLDVKIPEGYDGIKLPCGWAFVRPEFVSQNSNRLEL